MISLTISEDAAKKLLPYKDYDLLLDYDDGVGKLSKVGVCSLDASFRIIIVKKGSFSNDYNQTLQTQIGPIRYKDYSDMYMDNKMNLSLNPVNKMLRLTGNNSGELTASVAVLDMTDIDD